MTAVAMSACLTFAPVAACRGRPERAPLTVPPVRRRLGLGAVTLRVALARGDAAAGFRLAALQPGAERCADQRLGGWPVQLAGQLQLLGRVEHAEVAVPGHPLGDEVAQPVHA